MKALQEGSVEIEVPEGRPYDKEVFYNPKMTFDRNLSVVVVEIKGPKELCDALSATGVRGIRYKKETQADAVWLNDANPKAVELIKKNAKRNDLKYEIKNKDAGVLLREKTFDFIDVDPFGSPAEFLDPAASSIRGGGFLGITATDTSSFFGTYPWVSERRYGRKSMKTDYNKELGLRILVSALMESLGRYKKTFIPKLCYFREHYARLFGEVIEGAKEVQRNFEKFGYLSHCFNCGWRSDELRKKCPDCRGDTKFVEVYKGRINKQNFCRKAAKLSREKDFYKEAKLAGNLSKDLDVPYHFDLHYLAGKRGFQVPKTEKAVKKLRDKGFKAETSPYSTTGVKVKASSSEVVEVLE